MKTFIELLMESIGYTTVAAFIVYHYIRFLIKKPKVFNIKIKLKPWKLGANEEAVIN